MLKKLRKKVILINMLTVGVVLACAFAIFCFNAYRTSSAELTKSLQIAARADFGDGQDKFNIGWDGDQEGGGHPSQPAAEATVTITLDSDGTISQISENGASISADVMDIAVGQVMASEKASGTLPSLGLMFFKQITPDGIKIAFAGTSGILSALQKNVIVSALMFLLGVGAFFLISLWLSGVVVKPTAEAWKRQKQFIADASHELKTPLTVILANNNILMSHGSETVASQHQWLESTEEEAKHMKGLVDQMLQLARSENESALTAPVRVEMSELLQEHLLYFEPLAYEKNMTMAGEIAPGIALTGDATRLRQLVQILLDNGIKYGLAGTEVAVSLTEQGAGALFEVRNLGEPIAPDDLPHIFDRFFRADKARIQGGYGLGLAIAKNIADTMGADISAASSPQGETTFSVLFPRRA